MSADGTPPIVDMGAYEYQLDGDCNLNWVVEVVDFEGCMRGPAVSLETSCDCADVDCDGDGDVADAAALQCGLGGRP